MQNVTSVLIVLGLFTRRKQSTAPAEEERGGFIRCPACRKELHSTLSRCPYCSAFLEITCPNCDRTTSRTLSNCPYCGISFKDIDR